MVYLKKEFTIDQMPKLKEKISSAGDIIEITFISKDQALEKLKKDISSRSAFLKTLKDNPLPDAFEIRMKVSKDFSKVRQVAENIKGLDLVEDVEYGQGWLGRFLNIFNLFKITGYLMSSLFFLIALFITANTVRLAFYSRQTEVEIMRLVGATEGFIKAPFYVEGLLQGILGGILGLLILMICFFAVSSGISESLASYVFIDIRFLSFTTIGIIILSSTFLGWFGCYLSLRQLLK
jgi:cell division transport system permease protein